MSTVKTYSLRCDGNLQLSTNFAVRDFASGCGADEVLICARLVEVLQNIRDHFNAAMRINSAFRTAAHNAAVSGARNSQHLTGQAADIRFSSGARPQITPRQIAEYAECHMGNTGGIGLYEAQGFVHIDTRPTRHRFINRNGSNVATTGFPGFLPPPVPEPEPGTPGTFASEAWEWARANGITNSNNPRGEVNREQVVTMLHRYHLLGKG